MVSVREKMSTLYKLTLFYEFLQPLFLIITVQMLQNFNHLLISFYYAVNVFCCFCYFHFLMKKNPKMHYFMYIKYYREIYTYI